MIKQLLVVCTCAGLAIMPGSLSAQSAIWTNRYNGAGDNSDRFNQLVPDATGNLYATGYTVKAGQGKDVLLAKLNSAGDTLWTRTYNYLSNLDDEANFVAIDPAGDIVIAGYSDAGSSSTKTDILLAKFSPDGTMIWLSRYNYTTANEDELPAALAIDGSGNIFLTGRSDHDANNIDDCLTLKYSNTGVLSFEARYDQGSTDRGAGVVPDQSGGCVITGRTNNGVNDDIMTVAYDAAGIQTWQVVFSGPGGDDRGQGIVRDLSGNIYITGIRASADDDDFVTVKYNATGTQQWFKIVNGGDNDRVTTIKIDAADNIYVTGQSDTDPSGNTNYDFRTVAYSSAGIVLWNTVTANPVGQEDVPGDIWIDGFGNAYITGKSDAAGGGAIDYEWMTVKLNNLGVQQWLKYYNGTSPNAEDIPGSIYADASGNVWVAGSVDFTSTQKDATALKYSSAGVVLVTKTINGIGDFNDKMNMSVIDASGNTYVTGYTLAAGQQRNLLVQKIGPTGTTLWTRTYDGTGENDEGLAIAADALGNVYVAGYSNGTGTFDDGLLIKYNSAGAVQWTQVFDYAAHQVDKFIGIIVTDAGDVYVTGYSDGDASLTVNYDISTWKYNSLGLLQWNTRFEGAGLGIDKPVDMAFDGTSVYVLGTTFGVNNDMVILQYDVLGTLIGQVVYNGASNGDDVAYDLLLNDGALYVTGSGFVTGNAEDYVTLKYTTGLTLSWTKTYNGTGDQGDFGYALAATPTEIYVTGSSVGTSGAADIALIKYNKVTGTQNWAKRYTGAGAFADDGFHVSTDNDQNIYTTGRSANATTVADYITLNYNPAGTKLLTLKYNGNGNKEDVAKRTMVDANGYLFVSGYSTGAAKNNFDFTTIKYCTPVPSATITAGGPTTICVGTSVTLSANVGVGLTYQWKKGNANIAGATASTYAATTSGSYKCVVTNANGCAATSKAISVTAVTCREGELLSSTASLVEMYPNPFADYVTIDCTQLSEQAQIVCYDANGRLVADFWIQPGDEYVEFGADLAEGLYVVHVVTNGIRHTTQLVKL